MYKPNTTTRNLDITWQADDPDDEHGIGRLRAVERVTVNGFDLHLEAYRIRRELDANGSTLDMDAWDPAYNDCVRAALVFDLDGWPMLAECGLYPGEYLIVATPFQD